MTTLTLVLTITHALVSIALIVIVLLQQGKQQGLSGAIAGGAETFFGKNKARTIDSMLKKFTTVVAALFIINSAGLYFAIANSQPPATPDFDVDWGDMTQMESMDIGWVVGEDGVSIYDEEGHLVEEFVIAEDGRTITDPDGNIAESFYASNGVIWMQQQVQGGGDFGGDFGDIDWEEMFGGDVEFDEDGNPIIDLNFDDIIAGDED